MADREELPVANDSNGIGGITGTNPGIEGHRQFRQMDNPRDRFELIRSEAGGCESMVLVWDRHTESVIDVFDAQEAAAYGMDAGL